MAKLYDIAILGGTPAGYVAARHLADKGLDVYVAASPNESAEGPLCDWAPRDVFKLSELPGNLASRSGAVEFKKVYYHNQALERTVEYTSRQPAGHFYKYPEFNEALRSAAVDAGARVRKADDPPVIQLEEDRVVLDGDHRTRAQLLLVAHRRPADIVTQLALPVRTVPRSSLIVAGLDVPLSSAARKKTPPAMHVVEMPERSELGMFFPANSTLHLRVVSASMAAGNRAMELSNLVASLQQAQLLPDDLDLAGARGAVWYPPAGVALELESHVAKRCVLIGTAGGFCESITGHSLLPSVRSALLAADLAAKALKADDPQSALMSFKNQWRKALADYLRPPNTSLHMLLPLLFANERIVGKFTRALLYGENI